MHPSLSPATVVVSAGRPRPEPNAGLSTPVTFASTYVASDGAPRPDDLGYGRWTNPTWEAFEDALGSLEGGRALLFGSGMAAIAATLSLVPSGGVVVLPRYAYNGTLGLVSALAAAGHVHARHVDVHDVAAVTRALPGAHLLWIETPTNPLLDVADLPTLVAAGRRVGALVAVDNTFATPLLQRPLEHGADVVVHSVTKYLAGHSDVVLGAAVTADDATRAALRTYRTLHGAVPGPMEAFLALRGLRTLHLRVERSGANAAELARRLAGHPAVERVRYPGFGSMISIEVGGGAVEAERLVSGVRLWVHATSLGGVESTLERRRRHAGEPAGVPENLVRLSVGVEDVADLWADLEQALAGTRGPGAELS
ncbi:MAG TPA: aminotransferase class I/II-fold pyridoxal phosphate-dependent enzyme [Kineosporiaceae bacterium]